MCQIIIIKKDNKNELDRKQMERFQKSNPHGMGVAVITKDKSIIDKTIDTVDDLMVYVAEARKVGDVIIHFRYATGASDKTKENAHPFSFNNMNRNKLQFVTNERLLFHNGVLSTYEGNKEVDTYNFLQLALKQNKQYIEMLSLYSKNNRFALIEGGNIFTFGDWKEDNGFMYANDRGVKEPTYTSYYNNYNRPNVGGGYKSGSYKSWWEEETENEYLSDIQTKSLGIKKDNKKNKACDIEAALDSFKGMTAFPSYIPTLQMVKGGDLGASDIFALLELAGIEDSNLKEFANLLFQEEIISAEELGEVIYILSQYNKGV